MLLRAPHSISPGGFRRAGAESLTTGLDDSALDRGSAAGGQSLS